ncbi:MAG: curli production assembly protein CsgG [Burkholderiales bacterium]|nr:curli production assembly protein CsgG [Burkholderiales bacterium]
MMRYTLFLLTVLAFWVAGCATVTTPPQPTEGPASRAEQQEAQRSAQTAVKQVLKRKVAVGRFSNETRYGRTLQVDQNLNPLGKQAADILTSRLVDTGQFLVLERSDLNLVLNEQSLSENTKSVIGADTLIVGSITEFGRTTTGERGFLSSTKVQTAEAKVEIRLVDVHTGQAFFSASGSGKAGTESGEVMGFGSRADYDGTLNDRAISAAISDVLGKLLTKLEERPWRTDILKVSGQQVFIAAGARQGVRVGDTFNIYKKGDRIKNPSTGFMIELPPSPVGTLQIVALFGDSDTNEGAVAQLISGTLTAAGEQLFVGQ